MKFQFMLILQKRFCLIDSPIDFELVCNPFGTFDLRDGSHQFIGNRYDIGGTDVCARPAGAWQFDIYKLLPEKFMKENPAFKVALCYDDSALSEGQEVKVSYSDIDLGEGVAGVNGQNVQDLVTHNLLKEIYNNVSNEILLDVVFPSNRFVSQVGANQILLPVFEILKSSNNHKIELYMALSTSDTSVVFDGSFSSYYDTIGGIEAIRILPKNAKLKLDYHADSTVYNQSNRLIGLNILKDSLGNFDLQAQIEPLSFGLNLGVSFIGSGQKYNAYIGNRITIYK